MGLTKQRLTFWILMLLTPPLGEPNNTCNSNVRHSSNQYRPYFLMITDFLLSELPPLIMNYIANIPLYHLSFPLQLTNKLPDCVVKSMTRQKKRT